MWIELQMRQENMDELCSKCHSWPIFGEVQPDRGLGRRDMANLPRFTLSHNDKTKKWDLKKEGSGDVVKSFATKAKATKGGVLEKAVGGRGSVRIKKRNGKIQEERTYPRSADPRGRG
jgi:hypothetical protein